MADKVMCGKCGGKGKWKSESTETGEWCWTICPSCNGTGEQKAEGTGGGLSEADIDEVCEACLVFECSGKDICETLEITNKLIKSKVAETLDRVEAELYPIKSLLNANGFYSDNARSNIINLWQDIDKAISKIRGEL